MDDEKTKYELWGETVVKIRARKMRLTRTTFEAVIIQNRDNALKVYMNRRAKNDPVFPGLWTVPGMLCRHGECINAVALRLEKQFGLMMKQNFKYVNFKMNALPHETLFSEIFLLHLLNDPQVDDNHMWFPMDNLPPDLVADFHHKHIIPLAMSAYPQWVASRNS